MKTSLVKYNTGDGRTTNTMGKCAFVLTGRTKLHVLMMEDGPMTFHTVDRREEKHMTPLEYKLSTAARVFRKHAKSHGASDRVKTFLKAIGETR